jgi:fructoselysine-6-P-deglycase FrlB-like protein
MYLIKEEIFSQYKALKKTYEYFIEKAAVIKDIKENKFNSLTFIGSGSSYCLSKSGEISAKMQLGIPANSLAAGDLILNFSHYDNYIRNTMMIIITRSGSTSEIILALKEVKSKFNIPCILICARNNSDLSNIVDLDLEIPWAFDESVCQTRTVSNLYTANLLLLAIMANNQMLIKEIKSAIDNGDKFIAQYTDFLKKIAQSSSWNKVVVLADSELQGIAEEGALAFKEISQVPSNYYHILDVRHGPIVMIDKKTLVIIASSPERVSYQADLIGDLKDKGAKVVTIGNEDEKFHNVDLHITIPAFKNYGVRGIPFIFVVQAIAYFKAICKGVNPDVPDGLDPWIKL